jgi:hypothetical protein
MVFKVSNNARGYAEDVNQALINNYNGWLNGHELTLSSDLVVHIATGDLLYKGTVTILTGDDLTFTVGDTSNPRIDLIAYGPTGYYVIEGVASQSPLASEYDILDNVLLARITRPANSTSILIADFEDLRVFGGGSGGSGGSGMSKFTNTFSNQSVISVNHKLGDLYPSVSVINNSGDNVIPTSINRVDSENVTVTFDVAISGTVIVIGGSSSVGTISGIAKKVETFTATDSYVITHNFGDSNPLVMVYDSTGKVLEPYSIEVVDGNSVDVNFGAVMSGTIVVQGGTFNGSNTLPLNSGAGKIIYDDGSLYQQLDAGTSNQILTSNGSAAPSWETNESVIRKNEREYDKLSVTDVSQSLSISLSETNEVSLYNEGDFNIYINFTATADLDDFPILPGESITLSDFNTTLISAICKSAETSTLKTLLHKGPKSALRNSFEIKKIDSTDVSQDVSCAYNSYKDIILINEGDFDLYYKLDSGATLDNFKLESKKMVSFENIMIQTISSICDSGITSKLKILGIE